MEPSALLRAPIPGFGTDQNRPGIQLGARGRILQALLLNLNRATSSLAAMPPTRPRPAHQLLGDALAEAFGGIDEPEASATCNAIAELQVTTELAGFHGLERVLKLVFMIIDFVGADIGCALPAFSDTSSRARNYAMVTAHTIRSSQYTKIPSW